MLNEYQEVEKYIELSHNKSKKHSQNSHNSRKWNKFLEFTSALIAATGSLTMPLLSINGSDSITIAVVGNIFIFLGVITNTLAKVFGFITLEYIHGNLSNEFSDLETEFRNLQRRSTLGQNYSDDDIEKLIIKFQSISARSNVQTVKNCNFCCCYNN